MNPLKILRLKLKQFCLRIYDVGFRYKEYKTNFSIERLCHYPEGESMNLPLPHHILGAQYMQIGRHFSSLPGLRMECLDEYHGQHFSPKLLIGEGVSFNSYCHVGVINRVEIGDNVMIGSFVLITDHSHGELARSEIPFAERPLLSKGPVIIEDNVWIGEHACIMPGVTIGEGSIIGANAVVTHDVPPYSVAVGVPAKVVKQL